MDKRNLYSTAQVVTADLPGIAKGEYVSVVKYHNYNDTYTILSHSGMLQIMVDPCHLAHFVL